MAKSSAACRWQLVLCHIPLAARRLARCPGTLAEVGHQRAHIASGGGGAWEEVGCEILKQITLQDTLKLRRRAGSPQRREKVAHGEYDILARFVAFHSPFRGSDDSLRGRE